MTKQSSGKEKIRLSLEIASSVRKRLELLRQQTEAESITEVIRRSLAVYEFVVQAKRAGGKLLIERDGKRTEVELFH